MLYTKTKRLVLLIALVTSLFLILPNLNASTVISSLNGVKAKEITATSIKISWNNSPNVDGYIIYLKDGMIGQKYQQLATINDKNASSYIHNNLKNNTEYSYKVSAIKKIDGLTYESDLSYWVRATTFTDDNDYSNAENITFKNEPKSMEVGEIIKLSPIIIPQYEHKMPLSTDLRWWTSNKKIAKVDSLGNVEALKKGKVSIFVKSQNGITAKHQLNITEVQKDTLLYSKNINTKVGLIENLTVSRINSSNNRITWKKISNVDSYEIYVKNNKTGKYKLINIIKKPKTSYIHHIKIKNKEYVYAVKAVKDINGKKYKSPMSYWVSSYNRKKNSKYTNIQTIKIINGKNIIVKGQNQKLKLETKLINKNKKLYNRKYRWWTSNNHIATINSKGYLKTHKPGTVIVYVKAHNGYTASTKIKVIPYEASKIPILTFHRIVTDYNKKTYYRNDQWVASVSDFEKQMKYLYNNNYTTISCEEFENWYDKKYELPRKTAMITFDDGDYELYYLIYPILKRYNFKATAFLIGSNVGTITSDLTTNTRHSIGEDKINELGFSYPNLRFESHSYNLHYETSDHKQAVLSKTYEQIDNDFIENKKFNFNYIAYPYGVFTQEFIEAAKNNKIKMGFRFGTDTYATRNYSRYQIPRVKINGQISYDEYVKKMQSYLN